MPGYGGTVLFTAGFLPIHAVLTATGLSQGLVVHCCAFSREFESRTRILDVNIAARLASRAGQGEVLISEATYHAARIEVGGLEVRDLELKGKSDLVRVRVLN